MVTKDDFTRIDNDINGNPRYVFHYVHLINTGDQIKASHDRYDSLGISSQYNAAVTKAKAFGGRKHHTKRYGGGIAISSYNLHDDVKRINEVAAVNTDFLKEWDKKTFKKVERAILNHFQAHRYKFQTTHGKDSQRDFNPTNFKDIDSVLGLAYTSSDDAMLTICNSGYLMANDTHRFTAFMVNKLGKVLASVQDAKENEIYIEL